MTDSVLSPTPPLVLRVALLDGYQGILDGYHYRLDKLANIKIVGEALNGADFEAQLAANPVDVALMTLRVPAAPKNPAYYPLVHAIPRLLELYPNLAILVFSGLADPRHIRSIIAAGASGYINKHDAQIYRVLPQVLLSIRQGGVFYSPTAQIALRQDDLGAGATSGLDAAADGRAYDTRPARGASVVGLSGQPLLTRRQLQAVALCAAYPRDSIRALAVRMGVTASTVRNLLSQSYERLEVNSRTQAVLRAERLGLLVANR